MTDELAITEIDPSQIPATRTRASSEVYKKYIEAAINSKKGGLVIDTSKSEKTPKSIYWGLALYIRKNNMKDKLKAILREKDNKVFLKKL